ncbi:serine hydrolase [Falsibacillus pallidus]|uniref:Beta-lactamase family protein n=1 Tax=Falsibacillus pallidus TaxID=493781 RepID=A0A370GD01_9BACI|nr:serine hydrolase [Falsibacillus pallidus]RDI41066.1 beta-lactamase family protein [Falsibacillus pallidus]
MNKVIDKLREIEIGEIGIVVFSTKEQNYAASFNSSLLVPLASAAKTAIGFCVAKWVEEGLVKWDDIVEEVSFNPNEDSKELYPHFQKRTSLPLREAVEVMIACHDSYVAKCVVNFCGGWEKVNETIQTYYPSIHVTENPRDVLNKGQLDQMLAVMIDIYEGYKKQPLIWTPIINGLVRQKGDIADIPTHHLNHMTGGLGTASIDIGILGDFNEDPYIFALGAVNLPNRFENHDADNKMMEGMGLLYKSI